ncbi:MAG: bifunctional metallophosphatase/5'-nucleotidase [Firmicutes bacterium]|nr:bifunctional metallophosphatase/5'-nucleotidase [Bacillota bacterium]
MKRYMVRHKMLSMALALLLAVAMMPVSAFGADIGSSDIVILFSGDVHGQADENLGYAGLAAYKNEKMIATPYVALVDAGDAVGGTALASVSKGRYMVDAMNMAGYTAAVPGVHEFDYGVDHFLNNLAKEAKYSYISCNFINKQTGSPVFSPYRLATYGSKKVAFIGISDPQTMTKAASSFKTMGDVNGYSFCDGNGGKDLYEKVQQTIDMVKNAGVDYVIAIGHLAVSPAGPYTPASVIKNTSGITAFINGNSHVASVGEKVTDKDGNTVLVTCAGSGLKTIGQLVISSNDTVTASLISSYNLRDISTKDGIEKLKTSYGAALSSAFATTSSRLEAVDSSGIRLVDKKETNLGDLCADAYRAAAGADIGLVESKEIRTSLAVGDISYTDVEKVLPAGSSISVIRISGADLMDALEMSARLYPNENGGFFQVSGLTYDIQETIIPSVSVDGLGNFNSINGEYRVTNIMVGGKELDIFGEYTVAGTEALLAGKTGYTMFKNGDIVKSAVTTDNKALMNYIATELDGAVGSLYTKSQGRIDSIKVARQSEIDREVEKLVEQKLSDYEKQVEQLQKELNEKEQILKMKTTTVTASSTQGKTGGKRYIQVKWKASQTVSGMKYQVYKSTKKSSGYSKVVSTSKLSYKNTSGLKKGKTYYYKIRGYKSIGGKTYYTGWSNVVSRKVK